MEPWQGPVYFQGSRWRLAAAGGGAACCMLQGPAAELPPCMQGRPVTLCLAVQIQKEDGSTVALSSAECPLQNERDDTVDDLVKSDFLHEPG